MSEGIGATMDCPKCGKPADDSATYCPNCGEKLKAARIVSPDEPEEAAPPAEPQPPTAPMPLAETVPMAAAADTEAQAVYQEQMAQYERDLAAWQAQYGAQAGQPPAPGPPAGAGTPSAPRPAANNNRTVLIVAIVLLVLLLCACTSCGMFFALASVIADSPALSSISRVQDGLGGLTPGRGAATPQAAVEAYYVAVARGDIDAARAISTKAYGASLESDQFDEPQDFGHTIVGTKTDGDTATVVVHQTSAGVSGTVTLTYSLHRQGGGWLISGVDVTGDNPGTGGGPGTTPLDPTPGAY